MTAPRLRPDAAEIRRALALLVGPGDVFEIRSPDATGVRLEARPDQRTQTVYGYFGNVDTAAQVASVAFADADADGVYVTLNPLHSGCLARARNHFRAARGKRTPTTSDKDVTARRWAYLDFDVHRPAGICATHAEKARAFAVAQQVDLYLAGKGFPRPVVFDSGSGAALLYRVDLPAEDELVPAVLKVLSARFTEPGAVKIDTTVGNAARIIRLPGTVNGKGEDDPERPHRLARIHDVPEQILVVTRELLEAVVRDGATAAPAPKHNGADLASEIVSKHFPDAKSEAYEGGTRWKLTCPFNETHVDAAIFRTASGAPGFKCFHDSCSGHKWRDVVALLEPDRLRKARKERDDEGPRELVVETLSNVQPERVSWLWHHRVARGKVSLWQGNPGQGKSMLTIGLAAAVTTGSPMPGSDPFGPADVILASAEDALADTIRPRLDAAGGDPTRVHAVSIVKRGDRESFLTLDDIDLIEQLVLKHGVVLVIVDPLMAFLGKADAHKDQDVRTALSPLAKMAERTGAAVVVVVHMNKGASTSAIYRSGGSIGIVGAARTAFLVAPHPEDSDRHVVACVKSNIGPMPPALAYRIESSPAHGSARVRFENGTLEITADKLLAAEADAAEGRGRAIAEAENFLRSTLKDGPRDAKEVRDEAEAHGHSWRTVRRAQSKLRIVPQKDHSEKGKWTWGLATASKGGQGGQDSDVAKGGHLRLVDPDLPADGPVADAVAKDGHGWPPSNNGHLGHLGLDESAADPDGGAA